MRKVIVTEYNKEWPTVFEREASLIRNVLGTELIGIHHIGSTSVPGLPAKPIIDIMPVVRDISKIDDYNDQMMAIGYAPKGEFGIPGRRFFYKGTDEERTHHVHIFQEGSEHVKRHLAFRDYLRHHPDIAKKYGELKQKLAKEFSADIEGYIKGKEALVKNIENEAVVWFIKNAHSGRLGE